MKIELKNIKHSEFASHETNCFEAVIYIDGKRVGLVSNDGKGGCDDVHPHEVANQIDEYAKTLPPIVCDWIDPNTNKPMVLEQTHETIFNDLLTDWMYSKDLKKAMAKKILFQRDDGKVYETKNMPAAELKIKLNQTSLLEILKAKTVLNLLPFDKALTIYRSNANV